MARGFFQRKNFPNISTAWDAAGRGANMYSGPRTYRTPFSSSEEGFTSIDPSIRTSQNEALTSFLNRTGELRSRYMGGQSAFREARLDPLRRQFAEGRAQLQQNIGLRGLGGSSFGEQALTGFDVDTGKALGEAGAMGEMEDLQALSSLDDKALQATMNLRAQQYFQELAALGLSQGQINQAMQAFSDQQRRQLEQVRNYNQTLNTFHNLVTNWGDFSSIGKGGGGTPSM